MLVTLLHEEKLQGNSQNIKYVKNIEKNLETASTEKLLLYLVLRQNLKLYLIHFYHDNKEQHKLKITKKNETKKFILYS